jgi:hypothetical protein
MVQMIILPCLVLCRNGTSHLTQLLPASTFVSPHLLSPPYLGLVLPLPNAACQA